MTLLFQESRVPLFEFLCNSYCCLQGIPCWHCTILVPPPGTEPMPPALGELSLNHWTAREVPQIIFDGFSIFFYQISLWSLLMTLVVLFILTGTMLGPELLASIPAAVYVVAIFMPLAGYASGYGLATLFHLPPNCKRTVSLETGSQNVQLCTAILKLAFPPQNIGSMYMFPLLYALFQSAEAGIFVLIYKMYGSGVLHKQATTESPGKPDFISFSTKNRASKALFLVKASVVLLTAALWQLGTVALVRGS